MADRLYTSSEADEVLSALRFETKLEKATLARIAFTLSLVKDGAAVFTLVRAQFKLKGNIESEKAKRAVELSVDKYCSVAKTLKLAGAKVEYKVSVNDKLV